MKKLLFLSAAILCFNMSLRAQDTMAKTEPPTWVRSGGLGFDLSGLGIANPRVGAGQNRFGIGGLGTFGAIKKEARWYWDNTASLQLGVVRLGYSDDPFTKSLDVLRLTSKSGYSISKNNKWFATGLLIGTTSILKTYEGNFLKDTDKDGNRLDLFSKFLAPGQLQLHPGIEWKPDDHFSLLLSPVGLNLLYVGDDDLARKNIHGNEFGKNNRTQLVPSLQANYKNKFLKERITYTGSLNLTTDYLNSPFSITALNFFQNNVSIAIYKGLTLDLLGEANYDHYKFVQKDSDGNKRYDLGTIQPIVADGEIPTTTGLDRLGRGTQWVGSFLLKYNKIF